MTIVFLICYLSSLFFTAEAYAQNTQPRTDTLSEQVTKLESRIVAVETSLQNLREMINNIQSMFYAGIGFVGVLSVVSMVQQILSGRKERASQHEENNRRFALSEAQARRYEEFIKDQAESNKSLLDTTQKNINQITALLSSLNDVFKFAERANNLENELKIIREANEREQDEKKNSIRETAKSLNLQAMKICSSIDRNSYKTQENQERIRNFRNSVTTFLAMLGAEATQETLLNANAFFILGLDFALRYLFDEAINEIEKAVRIAKRYATEEPDEILYPDADKNKIEIQMWNKKLTNICLFHKGIIFYNLGRYREAENLFREAVLDYDDKDVKSMIYIPEAKYLQGEESFDDVIEAFERVQRRIEIIADSGDTRGWRESKEAILAQLYIRYGNCYFPNMYKIHYGSYGKIEFAENLYKKAYDLDKGSYIAKFSYAQALSEKGKKSSLDREKREALIKSKSIFDEVLDVIKVKIGETTEAKILIMLYYIVIVCCKEGDIERDNISRYITKIYEEGGRLSSIKGYRIFSPLSKSDLTYEELRRELEHYIENKM